MIEKSAVASMLLRAEVDKGLNESGNHPDLCAFYEGCNAGG